MWHFIVSGTTQNDRTIIFFSDWLKMIDEIEHMRIKWIWKPLLSCFEPFMKIYKDSIENNYV